MKERNEHKLRVFKFLHLPNTKWSHVYHSAASAIFCTYALVSPLGTSDGFILSQSTQLFNNSNLTCPSVQPANDSVNVVLICIDAFLAAFLLVEFILRLWSSTYIEFFNQPYLRGQYAYMKTYVYRRLLDLMGIVLFSLTMMELALHVNLNHDLLRILQVFQIYQSYRILFPYMRLIARTIMSDQNQYLLFTLFFAFMSMILGSIIIYLTEERDSFTQFATIFDALWYTYQTFTTIGYGDIVPRTFLSKVCACFLSVFGVFAFALPASIIGTSLSIKISQDYHKSLHYRKSVRLIQTFWRCRISIWKVNKSRSNSLLWRSFSQSGKQYRDDYRSFNTDPNWNDRDLLCIGLICKTKYIMARFRFKRQNINMSSYSDVSQQYAEIWQRIDFIENDLAALSSEVYDSLHHKLAALRTAAERLQMKIVQSSYIR